jgi:hypothetical protein
MPRLITFLPVLLLLSCGPDDVACDDFLETPTEAHRDPLPDDGSFTPTEGPGFNVDPDPACLINCCEDLGSMVGRPGLCALSEFPYCYDCEGLPALCMTHGCETPNAEDCCLSADGKTIAGLKTNTGSCV